MGDITDGCQEGGIYQCCPNAKQDGSQEPEPEATTYHNDEEPSSLDPHAHGNQLFASHDIGESTCCKLSDPPDSWIGCNQQPNMCSIEPSCGKEEWKESP